MDAKFRLLVGVTILVFACLVNVQKAQASHLLVRVASLPPYITTDRVVVSYTVGVIPSTPLSVQVQYKRPGDAGFITAPTVYTESSREIVFEGGFFISDGNYTFRVVVTADSETVVSNEVGTILDRQDPAAPTDYRKERTGPQSFRVCWKAPNEPDFAKVAVYKSKTANFTANNMTKHGEIFSSPAEVKCMDIDGLEANTEYFFAVQAIDKAGRGSGLVGDSQVIQTVISPPAGQEVVTSGVTQVAGGAGEVLSTATESATSSAEATQASVTNEGQVPTIAPSRRNLIVAAVIIILLGVAYIYYRQRRR